MISRKFTLFVIFSACSNFVIAQIMPQIGIEAGVTFAQSPDKKNRIEYYSGYFYQGSTSQLSFTSNPTPGILLGTTFTWNVSKSIKLNSGLKFQNINTRYHITGFIANPGVLWNLDEWGKGRLYKLSVPVSLGYTFTNVKIKPSVNIGTSFNYYLFGRINKKNNDTFFSYYDSQTTIMTYDETMNPFKLDEEYFSPARKFVNQLNIRLSTTLSHKLTVNLGYNIGFNNSCKFTTKYKGNYSTSYSYKYTRISNSDFTVSICYNIFNPQSSDKLKLKEKE